MSYQVDIVIIGAGVIGLAVASRVAGGGRDVYVLERNETFGRETSSRNSEVIHTSIFYRKGSLNARTCAEGRALLYELCEKHNIAYKKIGKLIVAVDDAEMDALERLYHECKADGVELTILSRRELNRMEPDVTGVAAIFSPSTGIVDSYGLMGYFSGRARDNGVQMVYRTEVIGIDKVSAGYKVEVREPGGDFSFTTRVVINCAGFYSDKIAAMCGIDIIKAGYKLYYCKGEYYSLSPSKGRMVNYLVYPMLLPGGLAGIHTVSDVWGRTRLGPDFYYVDDIDYVMNSSRKQLFYDSARRLFPFIEYDDIEPESAGVMCRLYDKGEGFREFVIRHEDDRGFPGFINLIGIESPGLTSSPAIARHVGSLVDEVLES
ncbi:MAG TPA: FAD-dependent oxidoreductase [Dehalococcoidia bacterium]|nr:FAD-dependent oxidoreductase [Dehalococcoidia bacterium]